MDPVSGRWLQLGNGVQSVLQRSREPRAADGHSFLFRLCYGKSAALFLQISRSTLEAFGDLCTEVFSGPWYVFCYILLLQIAVSFLNILM